MTKLSLKSGSTDVQRDIMYTRIKNGGLTMINPNDTDITMFKNGNSYALRVSKQDREALSATIDTKFKRSISEDGQEIIFRKVDPNEPSALDVAAKVFDEHVDLMKRLENL